ncbi:MAG: hypothetical protein LBP67_04340 [Bacteroidales bacterium]|jgi:hypothetical protein|nr:hypothetical protein [Bacteroidales bacterium]
MLKKYPKRRIELPDNYLKIYSEHYKSNREGDTSAASLSKKMESWMHKKVAQDVINDKNKSTLEIGAGTLNQLTYENPVPYDIIEPFTELYQNSKLLDNINEIYNDIENVPETKKYERITSVATFEHILNLPTVVAKTCLLLDKDGTLRASIPNEGSILWTLGWKLTTGVEFRLKYGLKYGLLMKYEHVNSAKEIIEVIKYFYKNVKCSYFGINKTLAFYIFLECSNPNIDLAKEYLNNSLN